MFLDSFHQRQNDIARISAEQACAFAKTVAGDFNPIHDADAKRFCVPGDLMFALVLQEYGLSENMTFHFEGMLGPDKPIALPQQTSSEILLKDAESDKVYLRVERSGESRPCKALAETLSRSYVEFSGHNFPHILVPLMRQNGVMINPQRPLVMYEKMSFTLSRLDFTDPVLTLGETTLSVDGKRGDARLHFEIHCKGEHVGHGQKKLLLSGLRPFCADQIQKMEDDYEARKQQFVKK
ncbi:DUF3581 family protein [Echinimonas agarilytica]|uniref:DUF3581 domain-containing protein n=1 Tax=Echinimonas agarilytica TaxID=1215918 RepID=A0AA42B6R7_9GAMM|nr:DUF3581 family protein [Echinimonas agarilytica]MCM2678806.1 DUF3581 domain-containing protein [Echinimonas agarilytica]